MSRKHITPIISKNDFVSKANEIYQNSSYDYSLIPDSFKKTDKLEIICTKHGKFITTYYKFIDKKRGCKECEKEYHKEQRRLYYQEKFIEESKKVHNNFYNYNKVYYRGKDVKVIITCPKHGDFEQTPHEHKAGSGCKECARERSVALNRKSTEWFIEKANQVHHNFYSYEKTVYTISTEPVIVTCPKHGDFEIRPASHLQGTGCPKCANEKKSYGKRKTTEEFIKESREIFGDAYDYSKTKYINAHTKVIITCPKHGDFEVTPNRHLSRKQGCPQCSIENLKEQHAKTTEEFIKESKEIFGDFYDYSKVIYVNSRTPVTLICPIHGEFQITPQKHLSAKHGCPECGKIKSSEANRYTLDDFIRVSNMHFHGFYDYSETVFTSVREEVEIICPIHGKFKTSAYLHMQGDGECPECLKLRRRSFEEFLDAAHLIYGSFYDYSEAEFVDDYTEIKIICRIHGPFFATPHSHLRNNNCCPECKLTNIERTIHALLLENHIEFETQKTFEWLKFKNNMHLDFYIDSLKVAIECQGIQHFQLCEFYKFTEETFELYKQRDKRKKELCNEHGIEVIYFSDIKYVDDYELGILHTDVNDIIKLLLDK